MQRAKPYSINVALLLGYKLVMDFFYMRCVYKMHRDQGWWDGPYNADLTVAGYLLAWLACAAILFLFRTTLQKPIKEYGFSEYILLLLLLFSVIPGFSMCGVGAFHWEYVGLFYIYWALLFSLVRISIDLNISIMKLCLSQKVKTRCLFLIGAVVSAVVVFVFFYYGGGKFFLGSLRSIYESRMEWRKIVVAFPLNYVMANVAVVLLFLVSLSLGSHQHRRVGLLLLVWYLDFSCGGDKIVLFSILGSLSIYAVREYITTRRILCIALAVAIVGVGIGVYCGKLYGLGLLVRVLFDTNLLGYCYYDFFQSHIPVLQSALSGMTVDREGIFFLIGNHYFGDAANHANNGLLGDAFLMAGGYGIVLGPILWMTYLWILDEAGQHLDWWIKLGASVYWVAVMQNSSFVTSLLSHGGVAMIILAYLCSNDDKGVEMVE